MPQAFWESLAVPLKCQVPTCAMSCGVIRLCHLEVVPWQCPGHLSGSGDGALCVSLSIHGFAWHSPVLAPFGNTT